MDIPDQHITIFDLPEELLTVIMSADYIDRSTQWTSLLTCKQLAKLIKIPLGSNPCDLAAHDGNLPILECAISAGHKPNEKTIANAAANGHLHIIEYLRGINCPWDSAVYKQAAANGHPDVIVYAFYKGLEYKTTTCINAAKYGHTSVIERLNYCDIPIHPSDYYIAASKKGQLPVIALMHKLGYPLSPCYCGVAAKRGHYHIFEWFERNNYGAWWEFAGCSAAGCDRVDILEWLVSKGYPKDFHWWLSAIICGRINVLDWLHANNVPMGNVGWNIAPSKVRAWARENGLFQ